MENTFDPFLTKIEQFNALVGGRWKLQIMKVLMGGPLHFGELHRELNGISQKVLTESLHDLEDTGLISRRVYFKTTVRVEYALTERGFLLIPVINSITSSINSFNEYVASPASMEEAPEVGHPSSFIATPSFLEKIKRARQLIDNADYVLIGLGSGFNSAFFIDEYAHAIAEECFPDLCSSSRLKNVKNIDDMLNTFAYITPRNETEYWSFWGRIIWNYCFVPSVHSGCRYLSELVKGKDSFILSTNPDTLLIHAGLLKNCFYFPLGNFEYLQCSVPCCEKVWNAFDYILPIFHALDSNNKIDIELIPHCPECGEYLVPNRYRNTHILVSSEASMTSISNFTKFLNRIKDNDRVVLIEIGSGLKLPYVIRYRFENFVSCHGHSALIRINKQDYKVKYKNILPSTIIFTGDISDILPALVNNG